MHRRDFLSFGLPLALSAWPWAKALASGASQLAADKPVVRLAFGSCNRQQRDQNYWYRIAKAEPDLWLWLGDIIYADNADPMAREAIYRLQKENLAYQSFCQSVPVLGTWDDHDYAYDNADGSYAEKDQSRNLLFDFLELPLDHPARTREAVYQEYIFGPVGRRVQVLLLDLRSFMQRNKTEKQLLGETQWQWLREQLLNTEAELTIIGSSLNVSSPVATGGLEGWRGFGQERQRLYQILSELSRPAVILSGDRHMAEAYRIPLPSDRWCYEFMSSGLTHATGFFLPHPGRLAPFVGQQNFGLLTIDWSARLPEVNVQIRSTQRDEVLLSLWTDFAGRQRPAQQA